MKKTVVTHEILDDYHERKKGREEYEPTHLFCPLCSRWRLRRRTVYTEWERKNFRPVVNFFKVGDEVIMVQYPNGAKGYYHVTCFEDPKNAKAVENILRLDVDKWNGVNNFIRTLVEKKLSDKQIIAEICSKYRCSYSSGYRRLRQFRSQSD